jgi:hypothetical protein
VATLFVNWCLISNTMKIQITLFLVFNALFLANLAAEDFPQQGQLKVHSVSTIQENPKLVQVGVNASDFIRQYLVFNSNNLNLTPSPYDLNVKLFQNKWNIKPNTRLGLRMGLGYRFNESSNTQNNSSSDFKTREESMAYRLGFEFQQDLSKRFTVFYGLDYRRSKGKNFTENKFNNGLGVIETSTNEQSSKTRGAQIAFGVQFKITNYLNINTEALFGYVTGESSTKFTGSAFPNGRVDAGGTRSFVFLPPSFINLNFMF